MAEGGDWAAEFIQQKLNKLLRRAGKFPFFFTFFANIKKTTCQINPVSG
jgi:hypothetical protein